MAHQGDQSKTSEFLHQLCSTISKFNQATIHSSSAQTRYTGQAMHKYVRKWELMSVHLVSVDAPIDKNLLITTLFDSFVDRGRSPLGSPISALSRRDDLTWKSVYVRWLQKYVHSNIQSQAMSWSRRRLSFYTQRRIRIRISTITPMEMVFNIGTMEILAT